MPLLDFNNQDYLAPKNSIPSEGDVIVKTMLYDINYTKTGREKAAAEGRDPNLYDGLGAKFCHLHYWAPGKKERQLVEYNGATEAVHIKFPCDITDADGTVSYCWIVNEEYLNIGRITNKNSPWGGYKKPETEADLLRVYDASLCSQLGLKGGEIVDLVLNLGLTNIDPDELKRVGIVPPTEKRFPVINVYRYVERWTNKEGKKEFKTVLTGFNRTAKVMDLDATKNIEWVSEATALSISEALLDRSMRKKNEQPF